VQLAAADEYGADLGQLAALAREPVRLGVHGQELGRGERRGAQASDRSSTDTGSG
jgi:hypothetical protein